MQLTLRPAVERDFDAVYRAFFCPSPFDFGHQPAIKREWDVVMANPTTVSMLVEDQQRIPTRRLVGFGQIVFVTDAFVRWARTDMGPWLNARVTRRPPDGSWPILDIKALRRANSGDGVNGLIARWLTAHFLSSEEELRVRSYISRHPFPPHRGYRYKEVLVEAIGEDSIRRAINAGFRVRNDYGAFYQENPLLPPPAERPCVLSITRAEAVADEGTLIDQLFAYTPPCVFFKAHEQELLNLALAGASDEQIAGALCVSTEAIKARWLTIFARVADKYPTLFPAPRTGSGRGAEKRTRLLCYLRDHLEELRPVEPFRRT